VTSSDNDGPIQQHGRARGAVSTFADRAAEVHALFGAVLSVFVVVVEPPVGVLVLLGVGLVGMWRDLLLRGQGHYFVLGVALVALFVEVVA